MSTLELDSLKARDTLRLGEPESRKTGWRIALFDGDRRAVSNLAFASEEQARRAHSAIRSALNVRTAYGDHDTHLEPAAGAEPEPENRQGLRQWTHTLLEEGQLDSTWGRIIEAFLTGLIVANVAAVALESIPAIYARFAPLFLAFEEFSLAAYTLEYLARLWSAPEDPRIAAKGNARGRVTFALRPLMIVDFLAIAPSFAGLFFGLDLRVLRIFRLFRLLKLARYSQALQALLAVLAAERSALFASAILLFATVCFYGELMHLVEGAAQPRVLGTMPAAMYWAITTLATVGYGDIVPVTPLGKFIAGVTMVTGLALFALPVGIIANGFVTGLNRRRFAITWSMLRRQPLFRGFDFQALNTILEAPTALIVREHAQIAIEGKDASTFYLIVAGRACAEAGETRVELRPGDMFGEEALHHSGVYGRSVTAETDLRLIAFPGDELRRLCRKYPLLEERIRYALPVPSGNSSRAAPRSDDLHAENMRLRKALSDLLLERVPEVCDLPK
ncbi:MAG TPA: cyclic nucleotide-gated ion channel [Rhizomicrobium sp.]|jgi:voltage-gated potassium channel